MAFGTFVVIICQTMVFLRWTRRRVRGAARWCAMTVWFVKQASDQSRPQAARLPGELAAMLEREGVALSEVDVLRGRNRSRIVYRIARRYRDHARSCDGSESSAVRRVCVRRVGVDCVWRVWDERRTRPAPRTDEWPTRRVPCTWAGAAKRTRHEGMYVATWVDAWRGEVYAALYQDGREIEPPTVDLPEAFAPDIRRAPDRSSRVTAPRSIAPRSAPRSAIARALPNQSRRCWLARWPRWQPRSSGQGRRPLPHAIRPLYVRRSDAELARDRS